MAKFLCGGDGVVHGGEEPFALAKRMHRAGFDQAFKSALVQDARVNVVTKVIHGFESADTCAGFQNRTSRSFTDILDGRESEADCFTDGREIQVAGVYVRRKYGDAHTARFVDVPHYFFRVAGFRGEKRGHKFDREMSF